MFSRHAALEKGYGNMKSSLRGGGESLENALLALTKVASAVERYETLPLFALSGRIAAKDYTAEIDQPPFDRSPFDGYAVNHTDIEKAAPDTPVVLRVGMKLYAGDFADRAIVPGEAARIMTGAPIPAGATCVVKQEQTDYGDEQVKIYKKTGANENFCFKGEDVRKGQNLIHKGVKMHFPHIGILAAQGIEEAKVYVMPKIGLLSTGNELVQYGKPLSAGKIYDGNKGMIAARIHELGAEPIVWSTAGDRPEKIRDAIMELTKICDCIITTGGVSVGERDYMPDVAGLLHAQILFHGVNIKPGSALMALQYDKKPVLCLSGNPFAAAATFELFAAPVIRKLAGDLHFSSKRVRSRLVSPFPKKSGVRRFVRAICNGGEVYIPEGSHASGILSSMVSCNCLIDIPADSPPFVAGDEVEVILF